MTLLWSDFVAAVGEGWALSVATKRGVVSCPRVVEMDEVLTSLSENVP